jgi:tetratricopeptide (TPR) repeat protein
METNNFYEELDGLYSDGDIAVVEAFVLKAIAGSATDSPERAGLYNELAGFYRGISRYAESEDAFTKALRIFESAGMSATPEYATVLLNFAGLYRVRGEADKAIELFLTAKENLGNAGARNSYAYISIINNLALAYQSKGDYDLALEHANQALELMRSGNGGNHEVAASLNNLAAIHISLGELETADSLVSEALEIYNAMPETDVHHAAAITTKAVIQCRTGDHNGALEGFRKALEFTGRFFGENIEFAVCRRNISDVYEMLGNLPAAITELTDAVRIMEGILGANHPSVQDAKNKLEKMQAVGVQNSEC